MASLTRWTWVWVNSSSWWWTWRPGMLRFMGSQWVGRDWATELSWIQFLQPQKRKKTKVIFQKTDEWFCSFYEWFIKWFGGLHTIMMIFSHQEADDNICYLNTRDRKELNLWFFLVPDFQIITKVNIHNLVFFDCSFLELYIWILMLSMNHFIISIFNLYSVLVLKLNS